MEFWNGYYEYAGQMSCLYVDQLIFYDQNIHQKIQRDRKLEDSPLIHKDLDQSLIIGQVSSTDALFVS